MDWTLRRPEVARWFSDPTASANPRWPGWRRKNSPAAIPGTLIRWVTGTPTERAVPFGAFSHLVEITDIGKPARLLRAARASLSRDVAQGDLLLIVDDAHDLDILSATLVYQLALAGSSRMIVTARAEAAPEAIAALWTDGLLDRIDVAPPGGKTKASEPKEVDEFIAELPAPARAVLNYLAVEEPLSLAALTTLAGDGAVEQAQDWARPKRGCAAKVRTPRWCTRRTRCSPNGRWPRWATRARDDCAPSWSRCCRARRRITSATGCGWRRWRWTATPRSRSTRSSRRRAAGAAAGRPRSLASGWPARRWSGPADLAARLPLAQALAWQGRGREADVVLAAVDPGELSETELIAWTLPRAANQFWMLGEPERATAFLRTIRNRVTDAGPRVTSTR